MRPIRINKAEFDEFRKLQKVKRQDCHAAFSTNLSEVPWPFVTYGLTPKHLREELQKVSPLLDQIVGIYLELSDKRQKGGRFFIDVEGCYWKDGGKNSHRFIEWVSKEPLRPKPRPITYQELKAMANGDKAKGA